MTATRVKAEGFPVTSAIVLGDLVNIHARMSWHDDHAIVEARFEHGTVTMSAPALLAFVREATTALATPVHGGDRGKALADYPNGGRDEAPQ